MPLIDGPDCRLWVEIAGAGDPVTVFAHGITGSTDELEPLAARTKGTRVLLDLRGHGSSDRPPADVGYDHPAMRRDLEFVADHFGATRAVCLSMGAGALMNLLADRPNRFSRVVLFTPASIDGPNEGAGDLFLLLADQLETMSLEQVADDMLSQPNQLYEKRPYWRPLVRQRVLRMNADGVPRALRAYVAGRPPVEDAERLRAVEAPALIIAHEGDPVHDMTVAQRLASLLPRAELVTYDEPLAQWDDVDATAQMIATFLDR